MAEKIVARVRPVHRLFYNKWFFDEIYDRFLVRKAWGLGRVFSTTGDRKIIDGCGPDGIAAASRRIGGMFSRFQSGYLFQYALMMMIGVVAIVSWIFYKMTVTG